MLQLLLHKALLPRLSAAWRRLRDSIFNPYRPELYYMRGPGPKWRAKNLVPVKVTWP
jgi:hypothetical protein